jgi:hypothetical protein
MEPVTQPIAPMHVLLREGDAYLHLGPNSKVLNVER